MDREFAEKWATALESGDYQQTKGKLFDGKNHCCLGVACVLLGETFIKDDFTWSIDGESGVLPFRIKNKIKMKSYMGSLPRHFSLSSQNDQGKSFKEIAQVIRNNVDEL